MNLLQIFSVAYLGLVLPSHAAIIINGDFETGDLTSWVNRASATIDSTTPLSGSYSALLPNDANGGAPESLAQVFAAQIDPVTLSFTFSMADPAGLSTQVYLGEAASGQINLLVWDVGNTGTGDVSIFDRNTGTFQTVLTDAVTFGATESFSLTFNGFGANFDYDLTVGSKTITGLSYSQFEVLDDFNEVSFINEFGNTGYEIDNVAVAVVPEPSFTVAIFGGVAGLLLLRRRRRFFSR